MASEPSATDLEAAWGERVRANRDQVDRLREIADGRDFYRRTSSMFTADPFRTDDPVLNALVPLARSGDVWLDIGAGAGRFALPLARRVREVVAIDPSTGMLDGLRRGMADAGITNVRVIEGRWPDDARHLRADVALIAHVGYDVERIGPFLDGMEAAAGRLCAAVLMEQAPALIAAQFWPAVHGEERVPLPALDEFLALLRARRREPSVQMIRAEPRVFTSVDETRAFLGQQTWVDPASEKGRRLAALVDGLPRTPDGSVELRAARRGIGIVTWTPAGASAR